MTIEPVDDAGVDAVITFFGELTAEDRTFIKEDLSSPGAVRAAVATDGRRAARFLARTDAGAVVGYLAVLALPGWSDHVAEIRLVVSQPARGTGVGRALARHALRTAVEAGYRKIVVELVADQEAALGMFTAIGFTGEALLRDHIRDREDNLRDLIVLAHYVDDVNATLTGYGLADELA